jgi:hypothetical protein
MPVERRGQVTHVGMESTGNRRNFWSWRKAAAFSWGGTSRMNREVHVRICERLGVQFPGPTRPQPFQLKMRVHAERLVSKPMYGAYAEVWMAPNKWRREIEFPGFTQLEIGDVDSKWLTRNLDFKPQIVDLTEVAVEQFVRPPGPSRKELSSLCEDQKERERSCAALSSPTRKENSRGNFASTEQALWCRRLSGVSGSNMPTSGNSMARFFPRAFVFMNQAGRFWKSAPTI